MRKDTDSYGALLLSALKTSGQGVVEITEREDGFIAASNWPPRYFSEHPGWTKRERQAIQLVKGRVLDIGCGAGRFALHLQRKGLEVTASTAPGVRCKFASCAASDVFCSGLSRRLANSSQLPLIP
jgi:SAM-dependent methyltransferase